jgi:hypothetical protein
VFSKIDENKLFARSAFEGWNKKDWTKYVAETAVFPLAGTLHRIQKDIEDSTIDSELKRSIRSKQRTEKPVKKAH